MLQICREGQLTHLFFPGRVGRGYGPDWTLVFVVSPAPTGPPPRKKLGFPFSFDFSRPPDCADRSVSSRHYGRNLPPGLGCLPDPKYAKSVKNIIYYLFTLLTRIPFVGRIPIPRFGQCPIPSLHIPEGEVLCNGHTCSEHLTKVMEWPAIVYDIRFLTC